jgi:hypothetical protein
MTALGYRCLAAVATAALLAHAGCANRPALLTRLIEARRLASELGVGFTKAADASNRAAMADTDEGAAAAAGEAKQARGDVARAIQSLQAVLTSIGRGDALRYLQAFRDRFNEYQRLDDEILPLAAENTNLKAQRLSFGAGRESADALRIALEAVVRSSASARVERLAALVRIGVLDVQVLQAPHIMEPEDNEMTRIEKQMHDSEQAARKALEELETHVPVDAQAHAAAAGAALDRFMTINGEILALSRRNSDVRSLALSFGRKRTVIAQCEDQLRALELDLAKHAFTGSR